MIRVRKAFLAGGVAGLSSAALCILVAMVPLNVLFGKLPEPPLSLLLQVLLGQVAPTLGVGALLLGLAGHLRRRPAMVAGLVIAAPFASLGIMLLVLAL